MSTGALVVICLVGAYFVHHRSESRSGLAEVSSEEVEKARRTTRESEGAANSAAPAVDDGSAPRAAAARIRWQLQQLIADAGSSWGATEQPDSADAGRRGPTSAHGAPLAPMPTPGQARDSEGLDSQARYVRQRLRDDLFPLVRSCYASERQRNPSAKGQVYIVFKIIGDPALGGVVDDVSVDLEKSDIKSPLFVDCVSNSLMTVSFSQPPSQVEMSVEYPMILAPSDASPDAGF